MTIDLRKELEECRLWLERKTAAAVTEFTGKPSSVGQIICLYNFDQGGWIGMDFDVADPITGADDLSKAEWKNLFPRPQWTPFYESDDAVKTFIRTDGSPVSFTEPPQLEEFISVQLSTLLVELFTTAHSRGDFAALIFRPGWQLSIGDFNGWWGWTFKETAGQLVQLWPKTK